jgi:hypothetical protein
MKRQTAVEWLVKELNEKIDYIPIDKWATIRYIVQQAKEMERQQIIDAWCDASPPHQDMTLWAEIYYKQTHESTGAA